MVSPDQRIDPNNRRVEATEGSGEVKRKPPARDFREVVEQLDEKRYKEDPDDKKIKKRASRSGSESVVEKESFTPSAHSIFDLARGTKDATDEEEQDDSHLNKHMVVNATHSKPKNSVSDAIEQPDISTFVPEKPIASTPSPIQQPILRAAHVSPIQEIIDQIVNRVYYLKQEGTQETVIDLKGAFRGSRLIITEFDSAKGEMNITFDGLTAEAQKLLEANRQQLLNDLAHKNVVVHIFTASPGQETTRTDALFREEAGSKGTRDELNQDNRGKKKRQ